MAATYPNDIVPFFSLAHSHEPLREALLSDIGDLIDSGAFTNGPAVVRFERAFADYCGRAECVGLASGLDALRLALLCRNISHGDEVIVPAATFIATLEAVSQVGAIPVPVDIARDCCMDPAAVREAITERTRAIIPVHLYGQLADMRALSKIADSRGIDIVEDACQAHGATRDGLRAGAVGVAAAFSFYPAKNLGALGDAGCLVCDDGEIVTRLRSLREHGQPTKYQHSEVGYTARLDTLQAVVLQRKLAFLDDWNDERRLIARRYDEDLLNIGDLTLPIVPSGSEPVWHLYVVQTQTPLRLADYLLQQGIQTGRHYPQPVHLTDAYAHLGLRQGAFPVAEQLSDKALSLPIFPGMTEEQQEIVIEGVREFFRIRRA